MDKAHEIGKRVSESPAPGMKDCLTARIRAKRQRNDEMRPEFQSNFQNPVFANKNYKSSQKQKQCFLNTDRNYLHLTLSLIAGISFESSFAAPSRVYVVEFSRRLVRRSGEGSEFLFLCDDPAG